MQRDSIDLSQLKVLRPAALRIWLFIAPMLGSGLPMTHEQIARGSGVSVRSVRRAVPVFVAWDWLRTSTHVSGSTRRTIYRAGPKSPGRSSGQPVSMD